MDSSSVTIGADVGGTTIAAGLVGDDGTILAVARVATHRDGPGTAMKTLLRVIHEMKAEGCRRTLPLAAIGVGLPGLVDADKGMMVSGINLVTEFAGVPLADVLRAATGLPAFVDNDANALALGEWTFGVGRGAGSLALLAMGTGVGGALILNDVLVRGASGCAGEFGHIPVDFEGERCRCGARGCLHVYAGGIAIADAARQRIAGGAVSAILTLAGGDMAAITSQLVFQAAADGDAVAGALVERALTALGAGIGAIVNAFDPEIIVITGGVAASLVDRKADITRQAAAYALSHGIAGTRIAIVPADKSRTVLGGAALARYELARRHGVPVAQER